MAIVAALLLANALGLLAAADNWLSSARMALSPRTPSGQVVLVDIDARSIDFVGHWPWPRSVYASVVDAAVSRGATEIAIDVDFSAPSDETQDAALAAALTRAGGAVILAEFFQSAGADSAAEYRLNRPLAQFSDHAWLASVNVRPDADGVVRRYPYSLHAGNEVVPSMALLLGHGAGAVGREFFIDFGIDAKSIPHVSLADLLDGSDMLDLSGKTLIVSATASELRDFVVVPNLGTISGGMVLALATESLLQHRDLQQLNGSAPVLAFAVMMFAVAVTFGRLRWRHFLVGAVTASALVEAFATVLQWQMPIIVPTAGWHAAIACLCVATATAELRFRDLLARLWSARASSAEATLSRVVTDSPSGIVVFDANGRVTAASDAAAVILGINSITLGSDARSILPASLYEPTVNARPRPGAAAKAVTGFTRVRRADGVARQLEYIITWSTVADSVAPGPKGSGLIVCVTFSDVTERLAASEKLAYMAAYDALTSLPNRNRLIEHLSTILSSRGGSVARFAIACFDLDGFKNVNDTLGHAVGDELLREVAKRAWALLPKNGLVARLGGDEFAVVMAGDGAAMDVQTYAKALIVAINSPFCIGPHRVIVSASVGVVTEPDAEEGPDGALMRADVALYRAKALGGNGIAAFEPALLESIAERQRLELDLWLAIDRQEFELWFQPQVRLSTGEMLGVEALLRWHHPTRGLVQPDEFIHVAESIGVITLLGQWILDSACMVAAKWPDAVKVAVNVSAAQFFQGDVVEAVSNALARSGMHPGRLEIEITESVFVQSESRVEVALAKLRGLGVTVALDDFGTGFSSLSYLKRLPIDKIKIDKSFVKGLPGDERALAIARAVTGLGRDLNIGVVAEGVETMDQVVALHDLGVAVGQGFLFDRPMNVGDLSRRLAPVAVPARLTA